MSGGWRYSKKGSVWENVENEIKNAFDPYSILNPDYDGFVEDMVYGGKAY